MTDDTRQPDGRDGESLLTECCHELGVSEPIAIAICEWSQEKFGVPIRTLSATHSQVSMEMFARCLLKYKKPYMPLRVAFWAMGAPELDNALGRPTLTEIARQCGCTKANVQKTCRDIQTELNLPPRKDQRTMEARQRMSNKRKEGCK